MSQTSARKVTNLSRTEFDPQAQASIRLRSAAVDQTQKRVHTTQKVRITEASPACLEVDQAGEKKRREASDRGVSTRHRTMKAMSPTVEMLIPSNKMKGRTPPHLAIRRP